MVQGRRRRRHREQVFQKKKKKEGVRPDEGGDNDRRQSVPWCVPPPFTHLCVCSFNIIIFWGVFFFFFLLSRSPSLRIKQPAFRVES